MQRKLSCLLAGALLLALGGCGGGGGGGEIAGGGATPPAETANPLVAPAGPLGTVLAADATELQPMRAGARWEYSGLDTSAGGAGVAYTSSVRHVTGANGALVDESTNVLRSDGTEKTPLLAGGGTLQEQVTDPLGIDPTETVTMTVLRSPVRVNDQYVVLQRSRVNFGIDADGDRLPDLADVVAYSTVIGTETVTLPALGRSLTAVRVDNTVVVRVTRSSDGRALPLVRTVQSDWYASGVGVVRRTFTEPSETLGPISADERLTYWDGVDRGLGATAAAPLLAPPGGGPSAPLRLAPVVASAVTGDTALLVTSSFGIAVLDRQGVAQRLRPWPFPDLAGNARLHGISADRAVLVAPFWAFDRYQVRIQQLDPQGDPVGASVNFDLRATSGPPLSAWDGNSLWLLWRRGGTLGEDIVLQPFGLDGRPLGAEQVLARDLNVIRGLGFAAGGGRLLATWVDGSNFISTYQYALRNATGGPAVVRTLGVGVGVASGDAELGMTPLVNAEAAALFWRRKFFTPGPYGSVGVDGLSRIVALDAAGNPVRSTAALDDELLPRDWYDPNPPQLVALSGQRLVVAGVRSGGVAVGAPQSADAVRVASVPVIGAPLATSAAGVTPVAAFSGSGPGAVSFGTPQQLVVWPGGRVIAIGGDGYGSMFSAFWLP